MVYSTTSKDIYFFNVIPTEYRSTSIKRMVGQYNSGKLGTDSMVFFSISGGNISTYSYSAFNDGRMSGTYML